MRLQSDGGIEGGQSWIIRADNRVWKEEGGEVVVRLAGLAIRVKVHVGRIQTQGRDEPTLLEWFVSFVVVVAHTSKKM